MVTKEREKLIVRTGYTPNVSPDDSQSKRFLDVRIRPSFDVSDDVIMCSGKLSEWPT